MSAPRIVFVLSVLGALAACGSLVGVTDLSVESTEPPPVEVEAGTDADLLPDTAAFDGDDGGVVEPPLDAGCESEIFGTFSPSAVQIEAHAAARMSWSDPERAFSEGGGEGSISALAQAGGRTVSDIIKFSRFRTFIPADRRIVGLEVSIKGRASPGDGNFFADDLLRLTAADNSTTSANHARPDEPWPTTNETRKYGGPTTIWELGPVLTPTLVNEEGFGIVYRISRASNNIFPRMYFDAFSLTVHVCK